MKLLHISDLHIGLRLIEQDLLEDQEYILKQIVTQVLEEKPQVLMIAGDIYDKAIPSTEAVKVFDAFIQELTEAAPDMTIMIISGNHDSGARINLYRGILCHRNIHMIGLPPMKEDETIEKVTLTDEFGPVNFYLLPFVKPSMVKAIVGTDENGNNLSYDESLHRLIRRENILQTERNVLVSHQFYLPVGKTAEEVERTDSEIKSVGNIDEVGSDILDLFDYAALGHIHKPWALDEFHRYCGTPLACSVSEAGQKKNSILVELGGKGKRSIKLLPLLPMREIRVLKGTLSEVCAMACEDYVSVVLTDKVDQDVFEMNDRLRWAFPHLLEVRRENTAATEYPVNFTPEEEHDPFELCKAFLQDSTSQEDLDLLQDIINSIQGVN